MKSKDDVVKRIDSLGIRFEFGARNDFIGFPVRPLVITYPHDENDVINIVKVANEFHVLWCPGGAQVRALLALFPVMAAS